VRQDILDNLEKLNHEDFMGMNLSVFYEVIAEIMRDLNFSFHRAIRDVQDFRRIEVWKHVKNPDDYALVWVEIVKPGQEVARDVSYEVLRTLNELNMVKLFFFTNGSIDDDATDLIEDKGHFVFTPENIIETLLAIKKKSEVIFKPKIKRKKPKIPSGFVLIRNFLKENKPNEIKTVIPMKLIPEFRNKLLERIAPIEQLVSTISDLDDINPDVRKKIKAYQFALLTDLVNIASMEFETPFEWMKEDFFYLLENYIMYLGALVEYEEIEDMERYLNEVHKRKENLFKYEDIYVKIMEQKKRELNKTMKNLFIISIAVIVISLILFIIFSD
jgi:hypothetical protein